ncbi:GNAT family N-acetyltransferase [Sneathiella marina]|uniref:GNAT family N-acetyltransferase n=1 Tax=Sneathiella marina TaxID=2950108 RepID=A0ABY4W8B1_9PROT|nr:peptidogalycan biosysnthesis protein [Sneathiella marina]USG61990.1 GNAT family N-acetyltransferase [Sneathiella marina]
MNLSDRIGKWSATCHTSIAGIPEADWNDCAGKKDPFVRHQHLRALEESGVVSPDTGFSPRHIALRDDCGNIVAAAPAYLKTHSHGELGVDIGLAMAHERSIGPYYPKLQVEVPFTPISGSRLLIKEGVEATTARAELLNRLKKQASKYRAASVQLSYMSNEDENCVRQSEFITTEGNAYVWNADGINNFDDFIGKMRSSKRSKLLSDRRKVAASGLKFRSFSGKEIGPDLAPKFYELYKSTFVRNTTAPWLNLNYFEMVLECMKDSLEMTIALKDEAWIAARLDVLTTDIRFAQHWGHTGSVPFLLFEMGIYQTIEQAIATNQNIINFGTTGLHKSERGIPMEPTRHAMWFNESDFNEIAEMGLNRKRESALQERLSEAERLPFRRSPSNEKP